MVKKKNRIISMDLIRLFSCICVISCHFNACASGFQNGVFVYPMFYVAYFAATIADFLIQKGITGASWKLLLVSLTGMDGYLATLGLIGYDFYKLGEWFLGCIVCLYLIFPALHMGVEKRPKLTCLIACALYAGYALLVRVLDKAFVPNLFFLRIPELLLGMFFIKYDLRSRPVLMCSVAAVAAAAVWLLRNYISPLTFSIGICMLLFALMTFLGDRIRDYRIRKMLIGLAGLTYPVFLVHHWMISRMIVHFDIAALSRRSAVMLYGVFLLFSFLLAAVLKNCTNKLMTMLQGESKTGEAK